MQRIRDTKLRFAGQGFFAIFLFPIRGNIKNYSDFRERKTSFGLNILARGLKIQDFTGTLLVITYL